MYYKRKEEVQRGYVSGNGVPAPGVYSDRVQNGGVRGGAVVVDGAGRVEGAAPGYGTV